MKQRAIVLVRDGQESLHPIVAEKMILGRDKTCDIVLDDVSVSRKHAAIICRFEKVYIENISPSGQILRADSPIEYAELEEDLDVALGPYMLHWRFVDSANLGKSANDEVSDSDAQVDDQLSDAPLNPDEHALQPYDANNAALDGDIEVDADVDASSSNDGGFSSHEVTQISKNQALPKLRIVKGEDEGREIKLDIGSVWVVGRSRKAHIHIESAKISRQHFKIVKLNNRYRVQDMGSATGTKLNGVTVSEAPLQPFDTIQAGSVEIQFLLVDSAMQHIGVGQLAENPHALISSSTPFVGAAYDGFDDSHNASTMVNVPVPYTGDASTNAFSGKSDPNASASASSPHHQQPDSDEEDDSPGPAWLQQLRKRYAGLKRGWYELPRQKRLLYGSVGAVLILLLVSNLSGGNSTVDSAANDTTTAGNETTAPAINVAQSPDISPTFYALSIDKQNLIRKLYSDSERSIDKSQWQAAFDSSSKILEMVDKYKRAKDILLQAQSNLNDAMFSKLSPSVDDAMQAAQSNLEQVANFISSGTQALSEKRWATAEASFTSALTLDPTNKEAALGLLAARKKTTFTSPEPEEQMAAAPDPDMEAKQKELDIIEGYRVQYQVAEDKVRAAEYHEAVPVLEELYQKLGAKLSDYEAGRAPAAIRSELTMSLKALQSNVQEAYENAIAQLDTEYSTQLADAEQFIANRQYVQAREIYDQIVERAPYYYKVKEARDRLYEKILSEAKSLYQGALIYESVGDLRAATSGLQKTRELLDNVRRYEAIEYRQKAEVRLRYLKR